MQQVAAALAILCLAGGCARQSSTAGGTDAATAASQGGAAAALPATSGGTLPQEQDAGPPSAEELCVDGWLASRGLDSYGHPRGTMYAGGTPLFDETTGERTDRLVYVYRKHPSAKQACAKSAGAPP